MTAYDIEAQENAFQFKLPVFEGPLDLLLYLIEREELEITAVSLVQVTDQYLSYLRAGEKIDAAQLAEFIAVAARLLLLKSRALLPRPLPDIEEEEDLGEDLVRRLKEYRAFREVAQSLREIEEQGLRAYPRSAPVREGIPLPTGLDGVTLDSLTKIVQDVLARRPEEQVQEIIERRIVTIEEKVDELSRQLETHRRVSFRTFISSCRSRIEVIIAFLAVLEVIKALRVRAEQDALFGDIALVAIRAGDLPKVEEVEEVAD
ncbi:MAG: ScpA family protein [Dehalococcoidia bacterium]